ncbi:FmdE family protein [Methanoculleus sp. MH98A]|uniref:FmdE family protein n=1 Tax=Methanoculleus sp. MH98A TaxID=1495314 RepID=UPI00049FC695|nr:FmdE family protein [Methanoculleus sp. MH98A]KDE56006.1 formylmethanofuran dehydrogenase [Methanoculleus sp. MH98A]
MCTTIPPGTPGEAHDRFAEAAVFHGHVCPGLATGYRAAGVALARLRSGRSEDEELVTIAETDACSVDAIQVLTGCTAGKGNLLFKDHGKHAFTFINRKTGAAIRVVSNPSFNVDSLDPGLAPLRARVMQGRATDAEHAEFHERTRRIVDAILEAPVEDLFIVREVDAEIPERARIFRSVACAKCGEMTAESRVRVEDGKFVCYACSREYSRRL